MAYETCEFEKEFLYARARTSMHTWLRIRSTCGKDLVILNVYIFMETIRIFTSSAFACGASVIYIYNFKQVSQRQIL